MGGNLFSHLKPALFTPRLSPALYLALRNKYLSHLSTFYTQVGTPLEVPDKPSYGDIDIVVATPILPFPHTSLSTSLAARASFTNPLHPKISDAVPHPKISYAVPHPERTDAYVQLDVHVCEPETFAFELLNHGHGDLWNILRISIQAFGLTTNNVGLHLRIPEIESLCRKQSLLHLTSDPDAVLDFLRLDRCARWRPFGSVEEMFAYAAGSRFFRAEAYEREGMNRHDRKKMGKRELYRRFVEEWVPRVKGKGGKEENEGLTRKGALEEALDVFGKRREYEKRLWMWGEERSELSWKGTKGEVRRAKDVAEVEHADAWDKEWWTVGVVRKENIGERRWD